MSYIEKQLEELSMSEFLALYNETVDDDSQKIHIFSKNTVDFIFKNSSSLFIALKKLGKVPCEDSHIRYDSKNHEITILDMLYIHKNHLPDLREVLKNNPDLANKYDIDTNEDSWQSYNVLPFLKERLDDLDEDELSEIVSHYFASDKVKLSDEFTGIVLVNEPAKN